MTNLVHSIIGLLYNAVRRDVPYLRWTTEEVILILHMHVILCQELMVIVLSNSWRNTSLGN